MTARLTRERTLDLMEELAALRVGHEVELRTYFINDGTAAYTVRVKEFLMKPAQMQGIIDVAQKFGLDAWFQTEVTYEGDDGREQESIATIADPQQGDANRFLGVGGEAPARPDPFASR